VLRAGESGVYAMGSKQLRQLFVRALSASLLALASTCALTSGAWAATPRAHAAVPRVRATAAYQNPLAGDAYVVGRTDMGVDICLHPGDRIRAIGDGVVAGIIHDWYDGQPYIWYQLTDGPDAGRYVYVAEQIDHLAHVGQRLQAGEVVARFARRGTCIEMGWGADGGATLAQATTGYKEGQATRAGVSFARFLMSLGVEGSFDLHPTPEGSGSRARGHRGHRHRHH
jgi:hypothetical protein